MAQPMDEEAQQDVWHRRSMAATRHMGLAVVVTAMTCLALATISFDGSARVGLRPLRRLDLGDNTTLGDDTMLEDNTTLGDNTALGHNTTLEELLDEHGSSRPIVGTVLVGAYIAFLCCLYGICACCGCLAISLGACCLGGVKLPPCIPRAPLSNEEHPSVAVRGEAYLTLALPWLAFGLSLALHYVSAVSETALLYTGLVLAPVFPILVRSKLMEWHFIAGIFRWEKDGRLSTWATAFVVWEFCLGALEVVDGWTDGVAVTQGLRLSTEAEHRFLAIWDSTSLWRWPAQTLGLSGMLAVVLAGATFAQVTLASAVDDLTPVANLAGMGGLAEVSQVVLANGEFRCEVAMVIGISRLMLETLPQLALQTSLLMAGGETLIHQPLIATSVLVSMVAAVKKALDVSVAVVVLAARKEPCEEAKVSEPSSCKDFSMGIAADCLWAMPLFLPMLGFVWANVVYIAAKLYFLEACPDHLWTLSTGCTSA